MERGSLIFRTVVVVIVAAVFGWSMHPLVQRDYYKTFLSVVSDKSKLPDAQKLVEKAQKLQEEDRELYPSQALERVSQTVDLTKMVKVRGDLQNNRDVLSMVRKKASSSIRLGLDLNGGVEFYLKLEELDNLDADKRQDVKNNFKRYREVAIETLRKRLEAKNIFEAEVTEYGEKGIALRAPIVAKDEKLELLKVIKTSARLEFRLVHRESDALIQQYLAEFRSINKDGDDAGRIKEQKYLQSKAPAGYECMSTLEMDKNKKAELHYYYVSKDFEMDGKNIKMAYPDKGEFGQRRISLSFNTKGAEDFARVTRRNVGRQLAIVLDGVLYCAPNIREPITGGNAQISGNFSEDEVKSIADALVSGSFPFKITEDAVFDTDPKLGKNNVLNGIWVGVFSLVCVALFMIVYYRLCGVISVFALCMNVVLIMGAMAAFDSTLTLPGIAGIILTIGMAVDANVLVFERIREELANGHKLRTAVDMGYSRAFSAVFDANITTLLTSVILYFVGTGAVKGFAVTLSIGILSTLFTALFVTRLIFDYIFKFTSLERISMLQSFKNAKYPFMRIFRWTLLFSVLLVLLLAGTLAVRKSSVLGVDFTGGTTVSFDYQNQIPQAKLEKFLHDRKYDDPSVTYKVNSFGDEKKLEITVRGELDTAAKDKLIQALNKEFPDAKLSGGDQDTVGSLIGGEFIRKALIAIVLSLIGIGIYISLRYEFIYAVSGVLMLLHDVAVVLAIYLATGRRLSLSAVAALLTVIGYSINDNVVIFDRMRENLKLGVSKDFGEIAELSINQTLSRTIITSITTFIVVFIQFVAGSSAINDFVFIMMLGVVLGTYSSVFLAAPTVVFLHGSRGGHKATAVADKSEVKKC